MCVISGCECLYTPPSRNNLTIWGILELIIMAICGLLCASDLIELFNSDAHHRTSIVLILVVVADVFIVLGLCLIIFGLFCSPSQSQIRSGIICFVVGAICFAVAIVYSAIQVGKIYFSQILHVILLAFLAYILWIQAGRM